jgi:hypothetical protein
MAVNTSQLRNHQSAFPRRTNSRQRTSVGQRATPKFALTRNPSNPSPTTTIQTSSTKTQSFGSDPSIPSYYTHTPPIMSAPTFPVPQPPSPHRQRNQRILSPQNSSRREHISPVSPESAPRTPLTFWREDTNTSLESPRTDTAETPMRANNPWDIEPMPVVQDARNSPMIVVRRPS